MTTRHCVLRGLLLLGLADTTQAALQSIKLELPAEASLGGKVQWSCRLALDAAVPQPRRLFLHLLADGKVYHVAASEPLQLQAGEQKLGPFTTTLPDDVPVGVYTAVCGLYGDKPSVSSQLTVSGRPTGRGPIINTGNFTDKAGTLHRWHVNRACCLYWDGEPYIPVGGMLIPDENFESFSAQIDLLARNHVLDIYFNVGNSIHMPHTWETKSDEKIRYLQKCIDLMDERGIRYGMEFSGLQAHGYAFDIGGGREARVIVEQGKPRMEKTDEGQWLDNGRVNLAARKVNEAPFLIERRLDGDRGELVASGKAEIARDERKNAEGKERGADDQVVRIGWPNLPDGTYRVVANIARYGDSWNENMHYWSDDTAKYEKAIKDLYSKVKMGPGFRFVIDAYWNENNFNHGKIPQEESFRAAHAAWLKARYGEIAKLNAAWCVEGEPLPDFDAAARCVPVTSIRTAPDSSVMCLVQAGTDVVVRIREGQSQYRYDLLEGIGRQVRDFHIRMGDLVSELFDVPVVFKYFSGADYWHINDAGIAGGHDGVGMETYGVGEPQLTFMGIPALGACQQSTKTMWLIASEIGEGNHQDAALDRNKLFGCTSRLGTMYPIYTGLIGGGAKGIYHYYMVPSPGADRFWDDASIRDPRQLEWLGTFARIVENAPDLADYLPKVYYRFPALMQPNSGLLFSDPHRDFYNTDCLWWVDPAGKLPNGAWVLPTFRLDVPSDMLFVNLENAPATTRWGAEVEAHLKAALTPLPSQERGQGEGSARVGANAAGVSLDPPPAPARRGEPGRGVMASPRVVWLGFRKDLGSIPSIDRYYTPEKAKDEDGIEFQVLRPSKTSKTIAANKAGQVWNLVDGPLQIISKSAENRTGWRPQQVVLEGDHRLDWRNFLRDRMGASITTGGTIETVSFSDRGEPVTVVSLAPPADKTVHMGKDLAYGLDATGESTAPPAMDPVAVRIEAASGSVITYPDATTVSGPEIELRPDRMELINSQGKYKWAREGLLFDTLATRASAIIRGPKGAAAAQVNLPPPAPLPDDVIVIEAERPARSTFNLASFSGLGGCSNGGLLGLATQMPPPAPDGYLAEYSMKVTQSGRYALWVREGLLHMASPGKWRIDEGPWQAASNRLVADDTRLVALYNALEDERMIFGWYCYGQAELTAGEHRIAYAVSEKRPAGVDIGLANSTPYGKLLDCLVLTRRPFEPQGAILDGTRFGKGRAPQARVNLLTNAGLEEDTGGWAAAELVEGRWKWCELRDERGFERDCWWTRRVPIEGRIKIEGLIDIGGLQVRQSYTGVRSLRLRGADRPRRFSSQAVPVIAGSSVSTGGMVRTETRTAEATIGVRFLDAQGRELADLRHGPVTAPRWQSVTHTVTVPAGASLAIVEAHLAPGSHSDVKPDARQAEQAWFDDLFLLTQK